MSEYTPTTNDSVFALLRRRDLRATRGQWLALATLTLVAWFGTTTFVGQYRNNQVAELMEAALPGPRGFVLMLLVSVVLAASGFLLKRRTFAPAAAIVAAFLCGHWIYEQLYAALNLRLTFPLTSLLSAVQFAAARLLWAASILAVALPTWYFTFARSAGVPQRLALGWGDWRVRSRDFSDKRAPVSYTRTLLTGYLGFVVLLLILAQAGVAFRPVRSGALLELFPAVLLSAAANAAAEEVVFRGVVQPAFMRVGGIAAGLWAQGALFGLVHWGTSVGVLAALPMSLGIGLGSVVWGKAAFETQGLGWVFVAHAMIDVAVMAAYFVA